MQATLSVNWVSTTNTFRTHRHVGGKALGSRAPDTTGHPLPVPSRRHDVSVSPRYFIGTIRPPRTNSSRRPEPTVDKTLMPLMHAVCSATTSGRLRAHGEICQWFGSSLIALVKRLKGYPRLSKTSGVWQPAQHAWLREAHATLWALLLAEVRLERRPGITAQVHLRPGDHSYHCILHP